MHVDRGWLNERPKSLLEIAKRGTLLSTRVNEWTQNTLNTLNSFLSCLFLLLSLFLFVTQIIIYNIITQHNILIFSINLIYSTLFSWLPSISFFTPQLLSPTPYYHFLLPVLVSFQEPTTSMFLLQRVNISSLHPLLWKLLLKLIFQSLVLFQFLQIHLILLPPWSSIFWSVFFLSFSISLASLDVDFPFLFYYTCWVLRAFVWQINFMFNYNYYHVECMISYYNCIIKIGEIVICYCLCKTKIYRYSIGYMLNLCIWLKVLWMIYLVGFVWNLDWLVWAYLLT